MNTYEQVRAFREAGRVTRCHTVPHIGTYSVAEHSWHMAMLYRIFCQEPSPKMVWVILAHDVAERWVGDSPATIKWASPVIKQELDRIEASINETLSIKFEMTEEEHRWLKALDLLELHLWCVDQHEMGNRNVESVIKNVAEWFYAHEKEVPPPVWTFWRYYIWERGSDKALPGTEFVA